MECFKKIAYLLSCTLRGPLVLDVVYTRVGIDNVFTHFVRLEFISVLDSNFFFLGGGGGGK